MCRNVLCAKAAKICWDMSDYWGIPLLMKFQHGHFRAFLSHTDVVPAFSGIISAWSWLLMVLDVALPFGPRHFGNPCCFCISNSDPYHFPRCFRSTGSSTSVGWEICRRRLCFMVKSCVIHCFRLRFSHLNQSIDQLGTVSISKSEFFFSRWLGRFLASLGRRTGSMFWGELISLSENIWKQKTFPGAKSFESEAFDSVWQRLTAFDIASWL